MTNKLTANLTKLTGILLVLSIFLELFPISHSFGVGATGFNTVDINKKTQILNGEFDLGRPGYSVKNWHLTAMHRVLNTAADKGIDEATINNYLNAYTLKTVETSDGNRVAALKKNGAGYVALTSKRFAVKAGTPCWISYDYFLDDIQNRGNITNDRNGVPYGVTDENFHGIQTAVREYDANGNSIAWTRISLNGSFGDGLIKSDSYTTNIETGVEHFTSANWTTIRKSFVPSAQTATVELYLKVGADSYVNGTVLFDNVKAQIYDDFRIPNGDMSGVTFDAVGGRAEGIAGPAGWTTISCTAGGAVTTENYVNSYVATIVPDPDNVNNPVLKYQYKNLTSTGYAFIQSPSISVVAGSKFRASFRYRITGQMAYTPKATVFFYDADGNEISRHHTNLNKSQPQWLSKTTSEFTVPANAVSAKIGFFGSRQNSVSSSSYPAEYIYSEGGRNFDTYALYFDDVVINGKYDGWTAETTNTNGSPRTDADYTYHYTMEKEIGCAAHKGAWKLRANSSENGIAAVTFFSDPIEVEKNTSYTVAFDLKIEGFKPNAENVVGPRDARLFVRYLDADGNVINITPSLVYQSGYQDRDWTSYNNSFTTNENAVAVQIGLLCGVTSKNTWDDLAFYWDNIALVKTENYTDLFKDPAVLNSPLYKQSALFVGDTIGGNMASVASSFSEMLVTDATSDTKTATEQLSDHLDENFDCLVISTGKNELTTGLAAGVARPNGSFDFDTNTYAGLLESSFAKIAEIYGEVKTVYVLTVNDPAYKAVAEQITNKWSIPLEILSSTTDSRLNWNDIIESVETADNFSCYEIAKFDEYLTMVFEEMTTNSGGLSTNMTMLERIIAISNNCPTTNMMYSKLQALKLRVENFKDTFSDFEPKMLGATIAVNDPNQIRFIAKAPDFQKMSGVIVKEMGVLVIPTAELESGNEALTIKNASATQITAKYIESNTEYDAVLSMENVDPKIEYTARAFVIYEKNGVKYTYYSSNDHENGFGKTAKDGYCKKSVYGIAKELALKLLEDKEKDMDFSAIGGVNNKQFIATAETDTNISLFDVYRLLCRNVDVFESWMGRKVG